MNGKMFLCVAAVAGLAAALHLTVELRDEIPYFAYWLEQQTEFIIRYDLWKSEPEL